jgi:transposase
MNDEIKEQLQIIEWALDGRKKITLNTSDVAKIIGVSSSTIDNWREYGCGIEYIKPHNHGGGKENLEAKKIGKKAIKSKARVLYPTLNVAKWLVENLVKTA